MNQVLGGDGYNKKALVCGGNGFIGHHLARRLKNEGYYVLVADIKECEYGNEHATDIFIGDLRDISFVEKCVRGVTEIYQLAADMGGCQYVFTGDHDADILRNSAQINMNVLDCMVRVNPTAKIFYSSSACMYPQEIQESPNHPGLKESDAYPANPDSEYGWEKLFSERLYLAYARNYGLNIRIARFHNIYGPEGTYKGGKEKAPASICHKVARASVHAKPGGRGIDNMFIWGDGLQTRSFLYIDDCVDAVLRLMNSYFKEPVNIGSEESISILDLWKMTVSISGYRIHLKHQPMPKGVMGVKGRNSNNYNLRLAINGWEPSHTLRQGMEKTFKWVSEQINK